MSKGDNYITKNEALSKLQAYCAYQERCHSEVRTKLLSLKIYGDDLEEVITELIKENFLNEERFARSYARGKFRIKHWGRYRIRTELKRKRVSEYCIKKAMLEIDENQYLETAKKVVTKYYENQKGKDPIRRQKTYAYASRRGFESFIINDILNDLRKPQRNG